MRKGCTIYALERGGRGDVQDLERRHMILSRDPSLLDDAVEYGLSKLGVESIKPEQLSAVCCLLA